MVSISISNPRVVLSTYVPIHVCKKNLAWYRGPFHVEIGVLGWNDAVTGYVIHWLAWQHLAKMLVRPASLQGSSFMPRWLRNLTMVLMPLAASATAMSMLTELSHSEAKAIWS